jgi:glycosyltransferase involved in cell wall biosynthesis
VTAIPRLSIGLPVYNGEDYLEDAIEALLDQSYENLELIISDNASTDSTADICQRYAKEDSRVRYFRQPRNIGLSPNHNFVFDQSRGEFFKWGAADDLYARDLLRSCVEALDERPDVVLAHSWSAVIDGHGRVTQSLEYPLATDSPLAPVRFRSILFGSSGLFPKTPGGRDLVRIDNRGALRACDEYGVIRSDVLRKIPPLGSYHHSDRIINIELALHGPFHQTPDWLYFRRDHPDRTYNASTTVRSRCAILDPARASWTNPTARLVAEYMLGYAGAIKRAPLSMADRRECYRDLAHWMSDRVTSKFIPRHLESFDDEPPADAARRAVSVQATVPQREERR